jgi:antibiotic biosynthesis monooxygenase (ABM) superfamily enzyme
VVARTWQGWTARGDADAYERFLRDSLIPQMRQLDGFRGIHILRRDLGDEVEFVTVSMFESLDAVRAFAGDDYETPVIEPEAERLLARYERQAAHYNAAFEHGA